MTKPYREESKAQYFGSNSLPTEEQLKVGCLQRIADATEVMAKNHQKLLDDNQRLLASVNYMRDERDRARRSIIAAKGQITKLRKEIASLRNLTAGEEGGSEP